MALLTSWLTKSSKTGNGLDFTNEVV